MMKKCFLIIFILFLFTNIYGQSDSSANFLSVSYRQTKKAVNYINSPERKLLGTTIKLTTFQMLGIVWYHFTSEMNRRDYRYNKIDHQWFEDRFISFDAIRMDDNIGYVNMFFHPFAGSFYYLSARSSEFNPYYSLFFSVLTSTIWEFIVEFREYPSLNDLIFTPFPGFPLGEYVYQKQKLLFYNVPNKVKTEDYFNGYACFAFQTNYNNQGIRPLKLPNVNFFFSDTTYISKFSKQGFSPSSQLALLELKYTGNGLLHNEILISSEFLAGGFFINYLSENNFKFSANLSPQSIYEYSVRKNSYIEDESGIMSENLQLQTMLSKNAVHFYCSFSVGASLSSLGNMAIPSYKALRDTSLTTLYPRKFPYFFASGYNTKIKIKLSTDRRQFYFNYFTYISDSKHLERFDQYKELPKLQTVLSNKRYLYNFGYLQKMVTNKYFFVEISYYQNISTIEDEFIKIKMALSELSLTTGIVLKL